MYQATFGKMPGVFRRSIRAAAKKVEEHDLVPVLKSFCEALHEHCLPDAPGGVNEKRFRQFWYQSNRVRQLLALDHFPDLGETFRARQERFLIGNLQCGENIGTLNDVVVRSRGASLVSNHVSHVA